MNDEQLDKLADELEADLERYRRQLDADYDFAPDVGTTEADLLDLARQTHCPPRRQRQAKRGKPTRGK